MADLPEPRFRSGQRVRIGGTDVEAKLLEWWRENGKPVWRVIYDPSRATDELLLQRGRRRTRDGTIPTDLYTEDQLEPIR